jgi:hypothetical protein
VGSMAARASSQSGALASPAYRGPRGCCEDVATLDRDTVAPYRRREGGPAVGDGTDPGYPGSELHVHVTVTGTPVVGSEATITATGTNAPQAPFGTPYGQCGPVTPPDPVHIPLATGRQAGDRRPGIHSDRDGQVARTRRRVLGDGRELGRERGGHEPPVQDSLIEAGAPDRVPRAPRRRSPAGLSRQAASASCSPSWVVGSRTTSCAAGSRSRNAAIAAPVSATAAAT